MPRTAEEQKEYDAIYQAEMDKLDAAAGATSSTTDATNPDPVEPEKKTEAAEPDANAEALNTETQQAQADEDADPIKKLEARLTSTEKALRDTKAWASQNAAEVKRLRKEQEERERQRNRPQLLDDNPDLEESIRYVTGGTAPKQADPEKAQAAWIEAVETALPELDELLEKHPELNAKAEARAKELGADWDNPLIAVRELGRLQREHERTVTVTAAQEAARRDFQQKGQKKTAMQVPSGSAPARQVAKPDPVKEVNDMSTDDFHKLRAKVLGYT